MVNARGGVRIDAVFGALSVGMGSLAAYVICGVLLPGMNQDPTARTVLGLASGALFSLASLGLLALRGPTQRVRILLGVTSALAALIGVVAAVCLGLFAAGIGAILATFGLIVCGFTAFAYALLNSAQ